MTTSVEECVCLEGDGVLPAEVGVQTELAELRGVVVRPGLTAARLVAVAHARLQLEVERRRAVRVARKHVQIPLHSRCRRRHHGRARSQRNVCQLRGLPLGVVREVVEPGLGGEVSAALALWAVVAQL